MQKRGGGLLGGSACATAHSVQVGPRAGDTQRDHLPRARKGETDGQRDRGQAGEVCPGKALFRLGLRDALRAWRKRGRCPPALARWQA